jgi:integrase
MKRENFTAERVTLFKCQSGKQQSIYWDGKTPGLGLRVTAAGAKSYIFQTDLHGKTIRMTIGDIRTWGVGAAQKETARLKTLTDQGTDPRQVIADAIATKEAEAAALSATEARETLTVGTAWTEYLKDRKPFWGERHYADHEDVIHAGGEKRKRSKKLTEPGVLASLATVRLVDLTPNRVTAWAKTEGEKRAGRARLAVRLLKAFLTWCGEHPTYGMAVTGNSAKNKKAREQLGKPQSLDDVLQKEQLSAWFAAVKQIGNPVISAYLQTLLLTGARPNEMTGLRWADVDFQWNSLTIRDKVEGLRVIPLTPYIEQLLSYLPRRNEWVFSSPTSASGHLIDPHDAHDKACAIAGLEMTLYGLRRSFATLSEWIEAPAGIAAQIQGHKPSGVREKHYIRRPLDLLRMWHVKIEAWILEQAGIAFVPVQAGLRAVNG